MVGEVWVVGDVRFAKFLLWCLRKGGEFAKFSRSDSAIRTACRSAPAQGAGVRIASPSAPPMRLDGRLCLAKAKAASV